MLKTFSAIVLYLKLEFVFNLPLEPDTSDWKPIIYWFLERLLNECLCNLAIQLRISNFCKIIGSPGSLNSALVITNQIPFIFFS